MYTTVNDGHALPGQINANPFVLDAPAGHPFNVPPHNFNVVTGTQFGDAMGQTPYPVDVVDWVLVSIRQNGRLPAHEIWKCTGWVHADGYVSFPETCPLPTFDPTNNDYYMMVQHRNHLGVMTPSETDYPCGQSVLEWDFTVANSYQPAFRFGQKQVEPGVWAMHAGNSEQMTSIASINSFDRTQWKVDQNKLGYYTGDHDLNISVNSVDETLWKNNQNRTSGIIFY
jgi:hypothetical protein